MELNKYPLSAYISISTTVVAMITNDMKTLIRVLTLISSRIDSICCL